MQIMKRTLALFLACMLLPVWPVLADKPRDGMSYVFSFYGDTGNNLVIAPSVQLSKKLTDTYYLGANLGVDAITSATKQAPTTPPPAGEEDEEDGDAFTYRVPVSLYLTYDKDNDTLTGGGYYSYEATYIGRSLFAAYTRRMNLNNTALGIAYSQSFDYWIPDRPLPTDNRSERTFDLSVTQLLSPRQTVQFTYTALRSEGFLAQPTDILITDTYPNGIYANYPDNRKGSAYAVRYIALLNEPTSLHVQYRYYRDDWHIQSDTVNIELYRDISPSVVLGARYRYYGQSASFFAKPLDAYTPSDQFIAVNYRMYAFHSNTVGAMAIIRPSKGFLSSFDADKVKLKLSADVFSTSSHPNIQYQ